MADEPYGSAELHGNPGDAGERRGVRKTVPPRPAPGAGPTARRPAAPQFAWHGGPLLTRPEVCTLFWGRRWQIPLLAEEADELNKFFGTMLSGPLAEDLRTLGIPGAPFEPGRLAGSKTLIESPPSDPVSDRMIRQFLRGHLSQTDLPQPSVNSLYFVFLPPAVSVVYEGGRSCRDFCGYHDDIAGRIFYAVVPYPDCHPCRGGEVTFDALTLICSHLLYEACTDPAPGTGWYANGVGEICDVEPWKERVVGGYRVAAPATTTQ